MKQVLKNIVNVIKKINKMWGRFESGSGRIRIPDLQHSIINQNKMVQELTYVQYKATATTAEPPKCNKIK